MLTKRAKNLKSSPTLELAAKGRELKSQGFDVISLAVGEPDWDSFEVAKKEAIESINKGFTKYVPSNGIEELRQAIAKDVFSDIGVEYSADQVTVTSGGKFSIFALLQVLIESGDEVLIPAPYWVSYPDMTELAEGKSVFVPSFSKNNFKITGADLEKSISKKSKLLILNSPSNPTGSVYSKEELLAVADVLRKHKNIFVLSDDIYNKLIFTNERAAPHLLQVAPDLKERVISINGGSKSFSMTGWRIGWAIGPKEIIQAMTKYQSQTVSCAASFTQRATAVALEKGLSELQTVRKKLLERKNFIIEQIKTIPDVSASEPEGAFYIWLDISKCFNKSFRGKKILGSKDFCLTLLDDQKVITVPGLEFGMEGYLRMSFALENAAMTEALKRMKAFISELKK